MEVLQDTYKDTKIGRIPKDWEVMMLNEITNYKSSNLSLNKLEENTGKYKLYGASGMLKGIDFYQTDKESFAIVKDGSGFGNLLWCDKNSSILGTLGRITNKETSDLKFCFYLTHTIKFKRYMSGSTIPHLYYKDYGNIKLPVPPLPEQQKIAAILSTVDEQINTTDKIIEKSKELKKGLMQRFFLNKAYMIMSLGKLEKTELMPIRFNQLGKILTGTTPPTANNEYYDSEDYMFIGPADLGKDKDVKSSKKYISVKGFEVTRKLPENALMVVCIGATIGKIGLTTEPCATNQQVNTIVPKDEYSARYLYYVIGGLKKYLLGFAGDTATPQLNKTDFGKVVTFIHKSKSERIKIATILSESDAKIEKEQTQKVKLETLKKGLMQQLLTGTKRVKV